MRRTLADVIDSRSNNFDLMRLGAALAVMFGHSFWIQPAKGRAEPILAFTGLEYSGSLAVYAFFLLSGVLVSSSFDRQQSITRFVTLRLARIYPALIACVFLTSYVLYPSLSTNGFVAALTGHDAWNYFATNTWLFSGIQWTLPHLFDSAPIKQVVNGSLWTLPIELKCYVLVLMAGLLGCFRSKWRAPLFAAIALIGFAYLVVHGSTNDFLRALTNKPEGYSFFAPPFFVLGMLLYVFRNHVEVTWPVAAALSIAYLALRTTPVGQVLFYVAFVYVLLLLSMTEMLHRLTPRSDYSYGIYVWAFPIQQIVASAFPRMDNFFGLLISVPLTLLIAACSWHLIEKPTITYFHRLFKKRTQLRSEAVSEKASPVL